MAERDCLAKKLEKAETALIILAKRKHTQKLRKEAKSHPEKQAIQINQDLSNGEGISSGNPHQVETLPEPEPGTGTDSMKKGILSPVLNPLTGGVVGGFNKLESGIKDVGRKVKGLVPGTGFSPESEGKVSEGQGILPNRPTRGQTLESDLSTNANGSNQSKTWTGKVKLSEGDERPLASSSSAYRRPSTAGENSTSRGSTEYPRAYDPAFEDFDGYGKPAWKNYLSQKDRPTHHLPLFNWMPELPLIGQKVDTIHYCRKELARLNMEIEQDQTEPDKFPLMNSAFIQFNCQVAAHMACQSVNHHIPRQMGPRYLEVNPNDIVWENMRIKWWERYIRVMLVTCAVAGLIIGWATPVAFIGAISQVSYLSQAVPFLKFIGDFPPWILGLISGIIPPLFLAILMALLPIILRSKFYPPIRCHRFIY